jgi:hypothetical protein
VREPAAFDAAREVRQIAHIRAEIAQWTKLVKQAKITAD